MKKITTLLAIFIAILATSCSVKYNFTGTGKIDANTFQVNKFMNNAPIVEPGVDRDFTLKLQDLIQNQTNLSLTNSNADLVYEGEIVDYRIEPMSAIVSIEPSMPHLMALTGKSARIFSACACSSSARTVSKP